MKLYRNFESQEQIDHEYLIIDRIDDFDSEMRWYVEHSELAQKELENTQAVKYGPTVDEYVDIFPAAKPGAPIMIFIHGGYWKMCSAHEFSFVALGLYELGFTTIVSNYSLCPKVSLGEITRQNRALISWVHEHAHRYNGDKHKIFVAGHSAGGQQTAMMAITDWSAEYGLGNDVIKGAFPISGLFDMGPFPYSFLQPALQLSTDTVAEQSPIMHIPHNRDCPMLISLGNLESNEFHRQSQDFHEAWVKAGNYSEMYKLPDENHFSVIRGFSKPDSPLLQKISNFTCGTT